MRIHNAEFVTSAADESGWPADIRPEIAFAGRSNVGKSSLINNLLNRKGLVKTSAEPGKTRLLNFFLINEKYFFTDLPGYGFAKGDKAEIARWKPMIESYLTGRQGLKALVHIVDIRREPDDLETGLAAFAGAAGLVHILVANKSDKFSKSAAAKAVRAIEKALGKKPIPYSAHTGEGKDVLWKAITPLLHERVSPRHRPEDTE